MECVLLGSGGMMPMPGRFLTSVVVRLQGQLYLFDAGEGCQINLKKTKLGIKSLRVVAVSHLHKPSPDILHSIQERTGDN